MTAGWKKGFQGYPIKRSVANLGLSASYEVEFFGNKLAFQVVKHRNGRTVDFSLLNKSGVAMNNQFVTLFEHAISWVGRIQTESKLFPSAMRADAKNSDVFRMNVFDRYLVIG